jgi:L-amino acid N-acyltransferase YncA
MTALTNLYPEKHIPPPAVREILVRDIVSTDPIFETLRAEYQGFDVWLRQCVENGRKAWVIDSPTGALAGVCIFKQEEAGPLGDRGQQVSGRILKLCTLKVSESHAGFRYGELLLKTAFRHAEVGGFEFIYATCFERHWELQQFMEEFGFRHNGAYAKDGDLYLVKRCTWTDHDHGSMSPIEFHVSFGPPAVKTSGAESFVIPIQPRYHDLLFPDVAKQLRLLAGQDAFGNAIRKAYLCHSAITRIKAGSLLLFYRSDDSQSIEVLGVAESTLASNSPQHVARFVGKRTVYPYSMIAEMCERKKVLAILFRQARIFRNPLPLAEIVNRGVIRGVPQSICQAREGGKEWLAKRIVASF